GFFGSVWDGVKGAFSAGWEFIKSVFAWTPLGLVMQAWEPLTGFFGSMWEGIKGMFGQAIEWLKSVVLAPIEALKNTLGSAWNALFGGGEDVEVAAKVKQVGEQLPAVTNPAARPDVISGDGVAAKPQAKAAQVPAGTSQTIKVENTYGDIVVHAAPGMNAEDVAREVRRQLDERDRKASRRGRATAYDV
ncbi:hypothetical protein ACEV93_20885, partial [Vibrio parahaemolyticus]